MATITAESVTNRTEALAHEVTSEILGMDDPMAIATIDHLTATLDSLRRAVAHPTNIDPLF